MRMLLSRRAFRLALATPRFSHSPFRHLHRMQRNRMRRYLKLVVNGGSGGVITADGYVGTAAPPAPRQTRPSCRPRSDLVTQAQLNDRNPQTLLDTVAYTPGTHVGAFGFDPRFDSFAVRGFDVTYNGVFRDNLRQPGASSSLFKTEPYGLEGVSILRPFFGALRRQQRGSGL